jgi:Asp-tRNA(Asn)/Glu-tRNA(Gln) amidotransferase A subunit family amidase
VNQVELSRAFRNGEISAEDFVSSLRSHFDAREPSIQAFLPEVNRFERLQKEAEALTKRFPDLEHHPALFGTLVGVKDIFNAAGFVTQAGSRLPAEELQGSEAESVTRLRNAGALILGKTVTTEFAYFTPGPTRNPHNLEHTPGGSSSGSAAAVGAGLCSLALGTQTIGSLIRPAAFCGTFALKPTFERISRAGVIPLSPSFDHIGFFLPDTQMAYDVARVLYRDWQEVSAPERPILGIPEGPYLACASDTALARFHTICRSLAEAGYELRRVPVMADYPEIQNRHDVIMSFDAAQIHKEWFAKYESLYSSKFSDLIHRGQKITQSQYEEACLARDQFKDQMTRVMDENQIDLWICPPTVGPAPKGLDSTGDPVMCLPWTQIGFPAVNLPAGKNEEGLPMGLQVVAKWYLDEALLSWSALLEKTVSNL